jgi:predicted heme/steroid binding protein
MSENSSAPASAPHTYTLEELARHDGSNPSLPVLIACHGRVYDVTSSYPWALWKGLRAGTDLTGDQAIHGAELLGRAPCVGTLRPQSATGEHLAGAETDQTRKS